ncbi:DUF1145 family protein [Moellerella wisconsensis]|uniref:DUF1145 family protein n=3 Tax=Moellerella wisconsensis TaxID=158849 RepID=A0A9Q8V4D1_9GAMM|nr:DUF1145 family protein [Moellerella wisconsensis]KLN96609.1 membrane protein [Moellerella wisconsensis]KPD04109.1 putative membrane protein [Moellerella wisconsensis ATCC 35017]UNH24549.1 DUF1145 family protein [Moellerella wisconsensis]UNH27654.1 DUF1145 family protein [Moellerella wisconsensis]UNH31127.1 DUF1145 family protein [Moellerella wisconsensis]
MLINIGRILMLCVWGFMIFNLVHPFPKPLKYFMDIAMIFMIFMHALQTLFMKSTLSKQQKLSGWLQLRIFLFGVFELLVIQKKQQQQLAAKSKKIE